MNTYGYTECPQCKAKNAMYRPLNGSINSIQALPAWNAVSCWNCGKEYKHTETIKEVISQ